MKNAHLGHTTPQHEPVALPPDVRLRHIYMLGKSGTGKSTLLLNLIRDDLRRGDGVAVLDPHGDLVTELLDHIPKNRTRDVIYFDPTSRSHTPGLNILAGVDTNERPLLISDVVGLFRTLWADFWGPRTEDILRHALAALLESPDTTLLAIPKLLTDSSYRARILRNVTDPAVRGFFDRQYDVWTSQQRAEFTAPLLNKLGALLLNPRLRQILGQPKSTVDIPTVLARKQIFLCNLSKGQLGPDVSSLLGALLFTLFELATLRRARLAPEDRHPYYLFLDEAHNFVSHTNLDHVLSESRKFGLGITAANQYLEQLPREVRAALFGNVGTILTFQLGVQDASIVAEELYRDELGAIVRADELQSLPAYHAYFRTLLHGSPTRTVELTTPPPPPRPALSKRRMRVLNYNRQRFTRPRVQVERNLDRFLRG